MPISFDGLELRYAKDRKNILKTIDSVLKEGKRSRSRHVALFEDVVATLTCGKVISTCSATNGLEISLRAIGVRSGDEVIVPAFSFAATAGCVTTVGAKPVFVDIKSGSTFIDENKIERYLTNKTKALIVSHLFGSIDCIDNALSFCRTHNLALIEDAAQAFGAYSVPIGIREEDFHVAVLSFDPFKVTPGLTGGGAIISKNLQIIEAANKIRCHGYDVNSKDFSLPGTKSEMSSIDAASLLLEIENYPKYNASRAEVASFYTGFFEKCGIEILSTPKAQPNNYHKFVIGLDNRDQTREDLQQSGIPTKIHYNKALPDYGAFRSFADRETLNIYSNARRLASVVLSLPIHPFLTIHDARMVCVKIRELVL
jgi:UDP-2-acetamido-2-deoxy-ribo-hexuluronate aminotransferase